MPTTATPPTKAATIGQFLRVPGLNPDLAARTFHRHVDFRHKITFNTAKGAVHFDKRESILFDNEHPKPRKKPGPKPTDGVGKWKNTFHLLAASETCLKAELKAGTKGSYGEIIDEALKAMYPKYFMEGGK